MVTPYTGGLWGEQIFTANGQWICPHGVTSVSVVCVGSGGTANNSGGGGGGGLGWKNTMTVVPGQSYTVQVGPSRLQPPFNPSTVDGVTSFFINESTVAGKGGKAPTGGKITTTYTQPRSASGWTSQTFTVFKGGDGGDFVGEGGGKGGTGGWVPELTAGKAGGGGGGGYRSDNSGKSGGDGGGAPGVTKNDDVLVTYYNSSGSVVTTIRSKSGITVASAPNTPGFAAGGSGGASSTSYLSSPFPGGGSSIFGETIAGRPASRNSVSNGKVSGSVRGVEHRLVGGDYGGGGAVFGINDNTQLTNYPNTILTITGPGAVRIVWPGNIRKFPSTYVGPSNIIVTSNVAVVDEGKTIAFDITPTGYPPDYPVYWKILDGSENVSSDDFMGDVSTSGTINLNVPKVTVTKTLAADKTTEAVENLIFRVYAESSYTTLLGESKSLVNDTSKQICTVTANKVSPFNEGEEIEFTITTDRPMSNKKLKWNNQGTTKKEDFDNNFSINSLGQIYGDVTTDGQGIAKFKMKIKNDFTTESVETILLYIGDDTGKILASSPVYMVTDTSKLLVPTYTLTADKTSVDEGAVITFTLTYRNIPVDTEISLSTMNTGVGIAGKNDYIDTGKYIFTNSSPGFNAENDNRCTGSTTVRVTATLDNNTEGNEKLMMSVVDKSGKVLATCATTIQINDTSGTPAPTYSIDTSRVTEINESDSVTFTIKTTNIANGTNLTWTNKGTTTVSDFSSIAVNGKSVSPAMTGSVNIQNSQGSITFTLKNDETTEGIETISLEIKNGTTIAIQSSTNKVNVNDTSKPKPTYTATPDKTSLNEGETVKFNVSTKNVASDATIYWAATGNIQDSDVSPPKGKLNLTNGSGSISIQVKTDSVTNERDENFYLEFRQGSTSGTPYYTSPSVTIKANDS